MKRVILAVVLMAAVVAFNIFSICYVTGAKNEITKKLDFLYETAAEGNAPKTAEECEKFTEYWLQKHHGLSRIVRHDLIDQITIGVSRLAPLAQYGETGELSSEILRCKILTEQLWDSEMPFLRNIF